MSLTQSTIAINQSVSAIEYTIKNIPLDQIKQYDKNPSEMCDGSFFGIIPVSVTGPHSRIFVYSPATKNELGKPI